MSTEKFRTREQILASKHWSGEDVGRAYIYSLLAPLEGKPQIPDERLVAGVSALIGNEERRIYEDYRGLYQFLTFENGFMQALEYACKAEMWELTGYLSKASSCEGYYASVCTESIRVMPKEFAKITNRTAQNITGESGHGHRYFGIDDIVDMIVYYSTMQDGLIYTPETYNNVRGLLGSELPEIKARPSKANMPLYNRECSVLADILDAADIGANPQIDAFRDMSKAQRAALRDSLCMRISNTTNYERYKSNPTMSDKFKEFRDYMRQWFGDVKISGHTLYYNGFTCFFILARHTDTIFYDCKRKKNGVVILPNPEGAPLYIERRPNVEYVEADPSKPAFADISFTPELIKDRANNGLLSLCRKRAFEYTELMQRPAAHEETYYFLSAYNKFLELIADRVKIPSLNLLKNDLTPLEEAAKDHERNIDLIIDRINGTAAAGVMSALVPDYVLTAAERRKLKDFFYNLPFAVLEEPQYKEEAVERVKHLIKELGIFSVYPTKLIKILQNGGEENE